MIVGAGAVIYGQDTEEAPRAKSPPVVVVRHAATTPSPIRTPTTIAPALPVAPPTASAPPVPQDPSPPENFGPIIAAIDRIGGTMWDMRRRLLSEGRDEEWASRSEALIRARYDRLNGFGPAGRKVDIVCGRSVCQVSGSTEDRPGSRSAEAIEALRVRDLTDALAEQGLTLHGMTFGPNDSDRPLFMGFYRRTAPRPPI